jgi:hypothetical protein
VISSEAPAVTGQASAGTRHEVVRAAAAVFNSSCLHALAGNADRSLDLLERVIDIGYSRPDWLLNDPDFAGIRDTPRFAELVGRMEANAARIAQA